MATRSHERMRNCLALNSGTVSEDKALLTLQLLVEGNSLRSTERIVGTRDVQRAGT